MSPGAAKSTIEVVEVSETPAQSEAGATPVSAIMTTAPLCVGPEVTLERLIPLLVDANIGGVPVVDQLGRPLGMVSKTDLLAEEADRADAAANEFVPAGDLVSATLGLRLSRQTAGELMSSPLLCLGVQESVLRAAQLMAGCAVHRLGVVDEAGRLVGVVSTSDVIRWLVSPR